jgi:hypothetical protein
MFLKYQQCCGSNLFWTGSKSDHKRYIRSISGSDLIKYTNSFVQAFTQQYIAYTGTVYMHKFKKPSVFDRYKRHLLNLSESDPNPDL